MSLASRLWNRITWLGRSSIIRLSLILSLVFAVGMAVAITVALSLGSDAIEERIDTTLRTTAATTSLDDATGATSSLIFGPLGDIGALPDPFQRAAQRGGGTVNLRDDFLRSEVWRVLVVKDSEGRPALIAVPFEDSEQAQELLAGFLWTTAALVIFATLTIGFVVGLLAQRRLKRINETLHELAEGNLGARTNHKRSRDDLDDIAHQIDRTAGELERLVTQTRHLSASLAHDLRTPLARLRARLEMLPEGDARADALEEATHLSGIFDTIMRVARIEAAQGSEGFESVDLGVLVKELAETFDVVVEDAGKTLISDIQSTSIVNADRQMLIQAMANLIQNALVHGGDRITLIAQGARIGISDNGLGVEPEHYAEIIKPMVRLDAARSTDGTGLGLALVRAVADRHNAKLELTKESPHGLRVILNFAEL